MSDRKSDAGWAALKGTPRKPGTWAAIIAEADRARASESEKEQRIQEQAREIERLNEVVRGLNAETGRLLPSIESLRAELERLKPSGQVAEDVALVRRELYDVETVTAGHVALARLAAGAQSAQAKDAMIQALADALVLIRNNRAILLHEEREAMEAALRLAGRLS